MKIKQIHARELYDSQGWPTVQCEIVLDSGESVSALVPSGRSVGRYEAIELRDRESRLDGRGVRRCVEHIEQIIAPLLMGEEPRALELDMKLLELDGTTDKSYLGANTMLAVSMALYRAEAAWHEVELFELFAALFNADTVTLPVPMLNIINGGAHASNGLRIQEFMIVPVGATTFRAGLEVAIQAYHELDTILRDRGRPSLSVSSVMGLTPVGLEGGFACFFEDDNEALAILDTVIKNINNTQPITCMMALDMAASQWFDPHKGLYLWQGSSYTTHDMIDVYTELVHKYPLYSLEDPFDQDDWLGWQELTRRLGSHVQIVGDDLFVTDVTRIAQGIQEQAATAALIKPNQIGTITETLQAISLCKSEGMNTIISHRSADTEDTFIADLAVGISAGHIKAGAPCRSERVAKYNRLLIIEDILTLTAERA